MLARLYLALEGYTRAHGGVVLFAPLDVVLTDFDVVQPDLLLFMQARRHLVDPRSVIHHAPDLAIEILSPETATNDRGRKMRLLEQHGVQEYWLVDPKLITVEIYRLADARFVPWSRAERIAHRSTRRSCPRCPSFHTISFLSVNITSACARVGRRFSGASRHG